MAGGKAAFGVELWWAVDGGALAKVAGATKIKMPSIKREMLDDTSHDSPDGWEEVIPSGVLNTGHISFEVPHNVGSAEDLAFRSAMVSNGGQLLDLKIVAPVGSPRKNISLSGFVEDYDPGVSETGGKLIMNLMIKPSGAITPGTEAA